MRYTIPAILLVASFLVLAAAPAIHGDLEGSVPEATAFTTQRKLVRFSNGTLALSYVIQVNGSNRVQVAESPDGAAWTSLNPPSLQTPSADRPSLAVDSRDTLHIAYTANGTGERQVWYASYARGQWSAPLQISQTQGYSGFPSIAVDSQDRVHVAWYGFDGQYYQIYYRMKDAAGWGPQVAVTAAAVDATNPALVLDGADRVHVAWYRVNSRGTGFEISYALLVGGIATLDTISGPTEDAFDPTLVVDQAGQIHVAWTSLVGNASRIAYVVDSLAGWSPSTVVTPNSVSASHPSLTLDGAGHLYLFYQGGDGIIYEERHVNGTWGAPEALTQGGQNTYPSARWSYYPLRAPAGEPTVDLVWTQAVLGGYSVRFASQPGDAPPAMPNGLPWTDFVLLGGVAAVVALAVVYRARRRH